MRVHFLLLSCLLFSICMVSINPVNAVSQTISVDAGQEEVKNISLKVDDEVFGRISVIGETDNYIEFYVTDPQGNTVVQREKVSVKDFSFKASQEGTYQLHFDNSLSTDSKTVTFNYDIRHFIFGIPQEDFLVFLIIIVAMIGLLLFVAMSRP